MLGLKPGEMVGQSVFDIYRDNPQVIDNVLSRSRGRKPFRQLSKSGESSLRGPIIAALQMMPELRLALLGVATDTTENRKAQTGIAGKRTALS